MSDIIECPICKRLSRIIKISNAVCNECLSLYPI